MKKYWELFLKLLPSLSISYGTSFLGFINFILLAKIFGADDFYSIAMGLAIGGFFIPLVNLGSEKTFVRDAINKSNDHVFTIAKKNIQLRLVSLVFVICIIILVVNFIIEDVLRSEVVVFSLWVVLQGFYPASLFDLYKAIRIQVTVSFFERLVCTCYIIVVMSIGEIYQTVKVIAYGFLILRVISIITQLTIWSIYYQKKSFFSKSIVVATQKGVSLYVTLTLISNGILTYGNQINLGEYSDKSSISSYALCFQLASLVLVFQGQTVRFFAKKIALSCDKKHDVVTNAIKQISFTMSLSIILCGFMLIGGYWLPTIFELKEFSTITNYLPLMSLWIVIVAAGQVITQYLICLGEEKHYMLVSFTGGGVAFYLGLIFAPTYGPLSILYILLSVHTCMIVKNGFRVYEVSNK